jgi:hypothetical protein
MRVPFGRVAIIAQMTGKDDSESSGREASEAQSVTIFTESESMSPRSYEGKREGGRWRTGTSPGSLTEITVLQPRPPR